MQSDHYDAMRATEDAHWWYRGNRTIVRALLARALRARGDGAPLRTLDAGCGTGRNLVWHAELGEAHGLDLEPKALAHCRRRGHERLVRGSLTAPPFAEASFDLVTCFEVLYHQAIDDWRAAITGLARLVRPGGVLLLREPAFPFLFGDHDRVVHGARRFRRLEFRLAVEAAGLQVERCSYQNVVTFVPALLLRSLQRLRGTKASSAHGDLKHDASLLGSLLAGVLGAERHWLRFANLPFGSSLLCLARRPLRG